MVEAASTVIFDTQRGDVKPIPRMAIAFIVCVCGCVCALPFVSNFGLQAFDVIDHYLNSYMIVNLGVMQCFGVGWVFDVKNKIENEGMPLISYLVLTIGFWASLLILSFVSVFAFYDEAIYGFIANIVIYIIVFIVAFILSKKPFKEFYEKVAFCGVTQIARSMTKLGKSEEEL